MRVGNVKEIVFSKDPKQMNWLREDFPYAEVKCPPEFSAEVQNEKDGDVLTTKIGFLTTVRIRILQMPEVLGFHFRCRTATRTV